MVQALKRLPLWGTYALLAYMPFHIFLSQWFSTFTGGLEAWKVGKDVITMALVVISLGLVLANKISHKKIFLLLSGVATGYLILHIGLYFVRQDTSLEVGALATVYNNRVFWYFLIGLATALLVPRQINTSKIIKVVLIVSTVVSLLGIVQYYLPKDFMTNFGYSVERGVKPAFFIDDKPDLPRIMSTIRDPNSLGAFLVIPLLLAVQGLFDKAKHNKRMLYAGIVGLHGLALFLTFSRASWLATVVGLAVLAGMRYSSIILDVLKKAWPWVVIAILILVFSVFMLRDQYVVRNIIFHSDESTTAELDSNQLHVVFVEEGIAGIQRQPLGHGPGTAGIVSIQNEHGGQLTENYFVQIGYEVGLFGLLILIAAMAFAQKRLMTAPKSDLVVALASTFWGYLFIGMVAHLWTNEAVALYWWLLAGLVIGLELQKQRAKA